MLSKTNQPARVPTWFHLISSRAKSTQLSGESEMVCPSECSWCEQRGRLSLSDRCLGHSAGEQVRAWAPTSPASRGRWLWGGAVSVCRPECVCVRVKEVAKNSLHLCFVHGNQASKCIPVIQVPDNQFWEREREMRERDSARQKGRGRQQGATAYTNEATRSNMSCGNAALTLTG